MENNGSNLVQLHILIPRELRDRMISLTANAPEEYFSTTEAWIKSARQFLIEHELSEEQIAMRKAYKKSEHRKFQDMFKE